MLGRFITLLFLHSPCHASPFTAGSLIALRVGDMAAPTPAGLAAPVSLVELSAATGAQLQEILLSAEALGSNFTLSTSDPTEGSMAVDAEGCEIALLGYDEPPMASLHSASKRLVAVTVGALGAPAALGVWPFDGTGYARADGAAPAPGGAGVYAVAGQAAGCAVAYFDAATGARTGIFPPVPGGPSFAARGVAIAGSAADTAPNYQLFVGSGGTARAIGVGLPTTPAPANPRLTIRDSDMGAGFIFANDSVVFVAARDNATANTPRSIHRHACSPERSCPTGGTWERTAMAGGSLNLTCFLDGEPQDLYFVDADFSLGLDAPVFFASTVRGDAVLRLEADGSCAVLAAAPANTVFRGLALAPQPGPRCSSATASSSPSSSPSPSPPTPLASSTSTHTGSPLPASSGGGGGGGGSAPATALGAGTGVAVGLPIGLLAAAGALGWVFRARLAQEWARRRSGGAARPAASLAATPPFDAAAAATRVKMLSDSPPLLPPRAQ